MMPAVTNTEAANQEKKLSSRVSLVRCLTGCSEAGAATRGLFINTLRPHRFQARDLASTLDERGWSSSGPTEVWLHGYDLGPRLGHGRILLKQAARAAACRRATGGKSR